MSQEKRVQEEVKRRFLLGLFVLLFAGSSLQAADIPERTLTGIFKSAAVDGQSFHLLFTHPATAEERLLKFTLTEETGMSGLESVFALQEGEVLQVDFTELVPENRLCLRIARVQMSGAPKGLEGFDQKDLFRKTK